MSSLHELLKKTVEIEASDLHLSSGRSPAFRVPGGMQVDPSMRFRSADLLDFIEESVPHHLKGRFQRALELDYSLQEEGVGRFRCNAFMTRNGPAMVFRHVKDKIPGLDALNLPPVLTKLAEITRGIALVCGSTGSGKSTTLASMIQHINTTFNRRIITVEDPVEYIFTDDKSIISQREIGLDTEDFHGALKRLLRQDPDVILIGEMRDVESFTAALTASETGHMVMTTLHTSNASQSIQRILDFSPSSERDQIRSALAENLKVVIAQRLLPGITNAQVPAVELMISTPSIRKLIRENALAKIPQAIEAGREDGMQTFDQALCDLIRAGRITEQTGFAHATNPQVLDMMLKGIMQDSARKILI